MISHFRTFHAAALGAAAFTLLSFNAEAQGDAATVRYDIEAGADLPDMRERLNQQGFAVRAVKQYARKIEVRGIDAEGRCLELQFHPATGEELRRKREHDCGRGRRKGDFVSGYLDDRGGND